MFPGLPSRSAFAALILGFLAWASAAPAATLPPGFTETRVTGGLNDPTAMAFAPDGRLFVAQQGGQLRVIENGTLLATPFLTVTVSSSGERGLLGVAFDPDFEANGFVYIYYTATTPAIHNRVSRFTASGNVAAPGSETILLDLNNLSGATNHNGGALHFGPDEKLYIAVGENADGSSSQTLSNLLGKILRINKDGSIPSDNPFFATASGVNRAIWALGLRNPFTFSFRPGTGRMLINDVGQNTFEEINEGVAGSNYGWPATEGPTSNPSFRSPIFWYGHGGGNTTGCAITGGAFYDPATRQFPAEYEGTYFFADFCSGWIRRLDPAHGNAVTGFATGIAAPVDLRVTDDGSLYYLARDEGAVYQVRFNGAANDAPVATITAPPNRALYRAGDTITYSGMGIDPEDGNLPASALTWRVDFHHDGQVQSVVPPTSGVTGGSFTIPTRGETSANVFYRIQLTVRDSAGLTGTTFHDVVPRKSTITLATVPAGLRLTLDGQTVTTPRSVEGVVGIIRTLGVVSPQTSGGITYVFESWSDGGAATHEIATPETATTYTARFRATGAVPGLGLTGTYYNNPDFTGLARTRLDSTVNFDWGTGRPITGIAPETFSVRWTGRVRAKVTGTHTFWTQNDDGVRLWVNGVQLIDDWTDHGTAENSGTIALTAGQTYDIRMDYYENLGAAVAKLLWSAPGLAKEVVPQSQLYPYVLLIAGSATPGGADEAVRSRLEGAGYVPVVKVPRLATAADANGKAVLVISSTILDTALGTRFRTSIAPIVTWETHLFDDLGLTPAASGNAGVTGNQRRLDIVRPAHPLAAGLSGRVTVTTASTSFAWGKPAATAAVIARLTGNTGRAAIFGYERGAAMIGLAAPARRVGLFLGDATAGSLTTQGWQLFDAAVRWASGG